MTGKAVCTEAQIRRAIKAAQKEGLPIAGVRPDGTVIIGEPAMSLVPDQPSDAWLDPSKWNKPGTT
jgi:hypothetical protein